MPRSRTRWCWLGLTPLLASCNLLTPIVFVARDSKTVAPEFDKLPGKRAAVLVWTDPSTLFDYPHARLELATYVADKLQTEMTGRKLQTRIVDPRKVEAFLQKHPEARVDPYAVGRAVDADYVIFLEIVRFQMRDTDHPQFLLGRIDASVSVHDVRAEPDQLRRYPLTPVSCTFPDQGPVPMGATNAPLIREGAYRKFSEIVARRFYEYTLIL